jgi:hypothetical protein
VHSQLQVIEKGENKGETNNPEGGLSALTKLEEPLCSRHGKKETFCLKTKSASGELKQ